MKLLLQKRCLTWKISYVRAVPPSKNLKRNCCLIFSFILEHTHNVNYMKEEKIFVKGAKIWSDMTIPSCHCFYYFRELYRRIAPSYEKRKELCQACSINFCTKLKIYLNKCGEKALLSEATNTESV